MAGVPNLLARIFTAAAIARAEVLLTIRHLRQNDVSFVVPFARAKTLWRPSSRIRAEPGRGD